MMKHACVYAGAVLSPRRPQRASLASVRGPVSRLVRGKEVLRVGRLAMRRSEWGWIAAGIVLAFGPGITAITTAAEPSHRERAGQTVRNRALARTDARVLLGRLMLPPGAQQAR